MRQSDYRSARALGKALKTDGSLVGKWLNGDVERITSQQHLRRLPELLNTEPDYFSDGPRRDRLAALEVEVDRLRKEHDSFVRRATARMARLEANLASPTQRSVRRSTGQ